MNSTYINEPTPYRLLKTKNVYFYAHYHQQVEIVYCKKGSIDLQIDGLQYTLCGGDCAVIWPNQRHYYVPAPKGSDNSLYLLLFYPEHIESFYDEWTRMYPADPVVHKEQLPDFFPNIWEHFYEVYDTGPAEYLFMAYTAVLTAHIVSQLTLTPAKTTLFQDEAQVVLNYVNQHFRENLSLKKMAQELGISTANLSRIFSKKINCTFMSHVNSLRVNYAKKLLRSSSYSVNEICFLSGFQSKRSFFRNFQEICGMSPKEYRERKT